VFSCDTEGNVVLEMPRYEGDFPAVVLRKNIKYLINPGSVGQPRDNDTRSAFAIWDTKAARVEFHRVEYPFEVTQAKMQSAGLPQHLIDRLRFGR
jgi:diadenosine tetraphosphatase ApaH/serine/threonine PP2A family protein phosphatase